MPSRGMVYLMNVTDDNLEISSDSVKKLPNMNEFSPGTLEDNNILHLLRLLAPHKGNVAMMINEISRHYTKIAKTQSSKQMQTRARNVLIGMSQCGLIVKEKNAITGRFTSLAEELLGLPDDKSANENFTRHLLLNCCGLDLIDVVKTIRSRGDEVSLQSIREQLRIQGFTVTENEGNASKIRLWMESSNVIDSDWNLNDDILQSILGVASPTLNSWQMLTRNQRLFIQQLRVLNTYNPGGWISVRQIKDLCENSYGRNVFPEGHLRAKVIDPLAHEGWLEARGTGSGRGGDSGEVRALTPITGLKVDLPIDDVSSIPVDLKEKLSRPLEQVFGDLDSDDTYVKGLALEILALRIISDIGLFPVCFRLRSAKTQGAEVDLVANGVHLHYSRWLIQCKNTKSVHVHDIAKEVGMAVVMKAHVIMMVTTGQFGRTVRQYAEGLASSSALQTILIDGQLLKKYRQNGAGVIIDWLRANANRVLTLKESQVISYDE